MNDCPYLSPKLNRMAVTRVPEIMSKTNSDEPGTISHTTGFKIKTQPQQDGMTIEGDGVNPELQMQQMLNNLSNEQLHDIMSANGSGEPKSNKDSVNEIIVKIEMKKF